MLNVVKRSLSFFGFLKGSVTSEVYVSASKE